MVAAAHTADLKNLDIRTIRPDTLEHIENVKINTDLPVEDCLKEFIESQIS